MKQSSRAFSTNLANPGCHSVLTVVQAVLLKERGGEYPQYDCGRECD